MKRDNKIALIIIGFVVIFILTFIFLGGLEAVFELLNILVSVSINSVENLIDLIDELINMFRGLF